MTAARVPGAASRSYGIHVAKLAGLPEKVIARAREILANLESQELDESGRAALAQTHHARTNTRPQLGLFAQPTAPTPEPGRATQTLNAAPSTPASAPFSPQDEAARSLATALGALDLSRTSPLDALLFLHAEKKKLEPK